MTDNDRLARQTAHVHRPGPRTAPGQPYTCAVCGGHLTYRVDDSSWQLTDDWDAPEPGKGWAGLIAVLVVLLAVALIWYAGSSSPVGP